jgi:hypothetical protein
VQEAVKEGRPHHPDRGDEDHAAEESAGRGKELGPVRAQLGHRAHPGEDHRRVEKGVDPGQPGDRVIPEHAQRQG